MANMKQAIKRIRINEKKRVANQFFRSDMRTAIKRVDDAIENNDVEAAKQALPVAIKKIDKAVQKGILHKNNGHRRKSSISKKVAELAK